MIPLSKTPASTKLVLSNSDVPASAVKAEIAAKKADENAEKKQKDAETRDGDDESEDEEELEGKVESLAIGTMLIRKKTRRELEDGMFHRYTYNETDLPSWFSDDEKQHAQQELPLTKEAVMAIRKRWKEINTRPIKKVAEAKARKKIRVSRKISKAKEKAMEIAKDESLSNGQKIAMAQKAMKKAQGKKKDKVYVVNKKSNSSGMASKRSYKKGARVKIVDRRMKKDAAAAKRRAKTKDRGASKVNGKMKAQAKHANKSKGNKPKPTK